MTTKQTIATCQEQPKILKDGTVQGNRVDRACISSIPHIDDNVVLPNLVFNKHYLQHSFEVQHISSRLPHSIIQPVIYLTDLVIVEI